MPRPSPWKSPTTAIRVPAHTVDRLLALARSLDNPGSVQNIDEDVLEIPIDFPHALWIKICTHARAAKLSPERWLLQVLQMAATEPAAAPQPKAMMVTLDSDRRYLLDYDPSLLDHPAIERAMAIMDEKLTEKEMPGFVFMLAEAMARTGVLKPLK